MLTKAVRKLGNKILLLIAVIAWTACSSDLVREDTLSDKGCTLIVDAFKSQATDTRALNPDGNKIVATWTMDDQVTVLNTNNAVIGTMKPTWIEGSHAKLKTTLNSSIHLNVGDRLSLVFPRTGRDYTGQKGTLPDIATNYDYATASVEVKYADESFVSTTDASFTNQQAIVRFKLIDRNDQPINASSLTIAADGLLQNASTTGPITITPTNATDEFYAALSGLKGIVKLTATANDRTYSYTTTGDKEFADSKYYLVKAKMQKNPVAYPEPLTLECNDSKGCRITVSNSSDLEYSKDGGTTWKPYKGTIDLSNIGDKVSFRGTWSTRGTGGSSRTRFSCVGGCFIYGNIMSLLDTKNYATMTELPYSETFQDLFMVDKNSTSNPKPNTQISHTEGKDLVLPATKLRNNCYLNMFNGCTNLNYIKCLATDISAKDCTTNWLKSTAKKGTFVKAEGVTWTKGDSGIPVNWDVKTE
jgi:hypothetical protein